MQNYYVSQLKKIVSLLSVMLYGKNILKTSHDTDILISHIKSRNLTYLSHQKLNKIAKAIQLIENVDLDGIFIEAGCALGGSSILIASLKKESRSLLVYDVFGMIPPPTSQDTEDVHERYKIIAEGKSTGIEEDTYYGYQENLLQTVKSNLQSFNINCEKQKLTLIQGMIQETLQVDQPVAFAHIDVDWYEPVMICLQRIFPHLVVGGSLILDDYHDWGGCKKATDEYLLTVDGQFSIDDSAGSLTITKIRI